MKGNAQAQLSGVLERCLGLESLSEEANRRIVWWGFFLAAAAMAIRIVFWIVANRYWEDALITCLHSENFARGLGLTHFRPGEPPLHGFTSPLSVLVPLIGDLMRVGFGVDFLKLVSIPAAALTVLYVLAIGIHRDVRLPKPLIFLAMGYAAFEHHQILWGMAGMETQLATLIIVMSVYYAVAQRPWALGLSLGLCMLARPDYAFWTVIAGVYLLFRRPKHLLITVPVALAVYLPWILFTFLYYGSPVPNTIFAKGLGYVHWWDKVDTVSFFAIKRHLWMTLAEQLHCMLGPTFCGHAAGMHLFFTNGPESPIGNLMFFFAVIGTLAILFKREWRLWPLAACVVVYSLYYVFLVPVIFGWYKVPYLLLLLLLSVRGLDAAASLIPSPATRNKVLCLFTACYLGLFAAVLPVCFITEKQIQEHIENAVRKEAGRYMHDILAPAEAAGCECLGYMGYYSQGNIYDWPGLNSREVVAWSAEQPQEKRCLENMLKGLQPEYLFLRDLEMLYWFRDPEWFKEHYHVIEVFQIDPEAAKKIRWLDRNIDTLFRIYRKKYPEDEKPYRDDLWPVKGGAVEEISQDPDLEDAPRV
jgi:hypothetical protein